MSNDGAAAPRHTAAMLVIGDEILSGRTRDANAHHLACELSKRGIRLSEIRVVADEEPQIVAALKALSAAYTHVFTSGGIGPTHDDITADAVAAAFGRAIGVQDEALARMLAFYEIRGIEMNEARMRMARVPEGAALIDNPISAAPGFSVGNVHVMAGVPNIFQAMVASVLPTLTQGPPLLSQSLIFDLGEGDLAGPLGALAEEFDDLSFGSYPGQYAGGFRVSVVVRGTDGARVDAAILRLSALFPAAAT